MDKKDEDKMDLLRLMKLVYIAHGFILVKHGSNPYIDEDAFQAWEYGPVLPELYREYKHHESAFVREVSEAPKLEEEHEPTLGVVWERYKKIDRFSLVGLTHQGGTPWHQCYKKDSRDTAIPDHLIKRYYSLLIEKLRESGSISF
jgi:uncharacterized phage-associated protein